MKNNEQFVITRVSAPFVFEVCKAVNDFVELFHLDPLATEFHVRNVHASSKGIHIVVKNIEK